MRTSSYTPISFWDDLEVYVEVATEKLDLRNLFEPVCEEIHVPITNFKGWSDLNSRAAMMRRFKSTRRRAGAAFCCCAATTIPAACTSPRRCARTSKTSAGAVGWSPENLIISRFGLNAEFIDRHGLTWIDNLETSSGGQLDDPDHNDHDKRYVQDYIAAIRRPQVRGQRARRGARNRSAAVPRRHP